MSISSVVNIGTNSISYLMGIGFYIYVFVYKYTIERCNDNLNFYIQVGYDPEGIYKSCVIDQLSDKINVYIFTILFTLTVILMWRKIHPLWVFFWYLLFYVLLFMFVFTIAGNDA